MKKVLLSLVLLTGYHLHSADALGEPPAKRVRIEEKPVTLRLSDGITEIKLSSSLAKAFTLLKNILEDLGESDEAIPVNNGFVTQDTLDQFEAFDSESIVTVEDVLGIINQYSLEQLVKLFLANNFLEFSKVFTMMQDTATKQLADILFEKIIEVLITTKDVNGVESALTFLDQLPNIAEYFKTELYKRAPWVLLHTLQGHTDGIAAIAFSPDGQLIVTVSYDRTAKLWNPLTGKPLHTLQGHDHFIREAIFSPNSKLIATASRDNTAKLWNTQTEKCLRTLEGHTDGLYSVAFSPDGQLIATASGDGTAKVWDVQTGECLHTLQGHTAAVRSVAFSPDGSMIVTVSYDRTAKLWDPLTGKLLHTLQGHDRAVWAVAFSPDGKRVATASRDNTAKLWNTQTGECLRTLEGHTDGLSSVAFSPNGQLIVTISSDKTPKVWDVQTGKLLHTLQHHEGGISLAAFSPNGQLIATASSDKTAKVWDVQTGKLLHTLKGDDDSMILSVAFSPDGQWIVTGLSKNTPKIWINNFAKAGIRSLEQVLQFSMLNVLHIFKTGKMPVEKIPAADSQALQDEKAGQKDSSQKSIYFFGQKEVSIKKGDDGSVSLNFKEEGSKDKIVVVPADLVEKCSYLKDMFELYPNDTEEVSTDRPLTEEAVTLLIDLWGKAKTVEAFIQKLPGYSFAQLVDLWMAIENLDFEYNSEQSVQNLLKEKIGSDFLRLIEQPEPLDPIILAKIQVTMLRPYLTELLYKNKWRLKNTLQGHTNSVVFSPDGQLIATASEDHTVKLWDVPTGQCLHTLEGHTMFVASVAFSSNGQLFATASWDETVKVWDTRTWQLVSTLQGHTNPVDSVAFSPDGGLIVTGSSDKTAKVWCPQSGSLFYTLPFYSDVASVAFSPDGKLIATGLYNRTAKICNSLTGKCLHTLQGHTNIVKSVAFSPDGLTLVTGSSDRTAKEWNALTGELLYTLPVPAEVGSVAFSPDGKLVAIASNNRTVNIWEKNSLKARIASLEQALKLSIQDVLHIFKKGEMPVKKIPAAESKQ